ncbi:unnamed protein product [Brachionus calyciflorus]|uniref:protein-tyrosine-phosphatase n=1 Tax=Brachionus calyciflorus TaxID=104777 RepID=A0A813MI13_9BILA|nr:unnamed protein product [Brachionus calyciflorus]
MTSESNNQSLPVAPNLNGLVLNYYHRSHLHKSDLNLIVPYLYLGSLEAAKNVDNLKKLDITHILTLMEDPLDEKIRNSFTYKFKRLTDLPSSNILDILEECIEFIENAIDNSQNILVHCQVGMSRSASIVIAYLMNKDRKPMNEILEFVKQSRFVFPNMGFRKQLEYLETCNYEIRKNSISYRTYKLEKMAEIIQMGGRFDQSFLDTGNEESNDSENLSCYKCKKCRFKLFNIRQIVWHTEEIENPNLNIKHKFEFYAKSNMSGSSSGVVCNQEIYIEPLSWFQDRLSDISGKINCPKCDAKLGSFDWSGAKCACGSWVTPAFHISKSKIDFYNAIQIE